MATAGAQLVHNEANPYFASTSPVLTAEREHGPVKRASADSYTKDDSFSNEKGQPDPEVFLSEKVDEAEYEKRRKHERYMKFRPYILGAVALVILGWWISSTVLKATRHRWCALKSIQNLDTNQ